MANTTRSTVGNVNSFGTELTKDQREKVKIMIIIKLWVFVIFWLINLIFPNLCVDKIHYWKNELSGNHWVNHHLIIKYLGKSW